jgi:hypothetical protein
VSPKSLALIGAAAAVLIMAVYLFIQVKSTPAQAQVSATTPPAAHQSPVAERSSATATQPQTSAAPTPTPAPSIAARSEARPIAVGNATAEPAAMAPTDEQRANPRMDSMMELANKAYDAQDFDQATAIAGKVLSKDPTNVRMLRVMVSSNCIGGDAAIAQQYYEKLPPKSVDREQMKTRCDKYQVMLKD